MALTQISTEGIKNGTITGSDLATNVDLVDNQKLRLGTGNDLEIYHSGSHAIIENVGDGYLFLNNTNANIYLRPATGEDGIIVKTNAAVELYHNNSKKFETTSSGVSVSGSVVSTGNVQVNDNNFIYVGNSGDLSFKHDTSNSFITNSATGGFLHIRSNSGINFQDTDGNENFIKCIDNGAVELYHDNSKKFDTIAEGVRVHGNEGGTAQLQLLADEGDDNPDYWRFVAETNGVLNIQDYATGNYYNNIRLNSGAAGVELYYDNSKKFETVSAGVSINGQVSSDTLHIADGTTGIQVGDSSDLKIYHNGSHSFIDNNTGDLNIESSAVLIKANNTENSVSCLANGAVELYYDNSKKFETTSSGVQLSGDLDTNSNHILLNDTGQLKMGASNDFIIRHNGTDNTLGGNATTKFFNPLFEIFKLDGTKKAVSFNADSGQELYHNNSKKFETTSSGIDVTGAITVNGSALTGGKVLQVVTATTTNSASTSSSSFVDTNVTANITPSATSSKILVMIDAPFHVIRNPGTTNSFKIKVFRDSTEITDAITTEGSYQSGIGSGAVSSNRLIGSVNKIILDSPSSTSQLTYKMQMGGAFNTNTVTFQDSCQSHITLMEVAA